jgi:hypothetical protein
MAILPILMLTALFGTLAWRLIRSGLRSDGHERWLGGFFGLLAISSPLRAGAAMGVDVGMDPALANMLGQAGTAAGVVCLDYFVWRVFRDDGRWGPALFSTLLCLQVLQMGMCSLSWAFCESLHYWRMLRRRLQLGMGDEVIANRFGLWTLWTGALLVFPMINLAARILAFNQGGASMGTTVSGEFSWAVDVIRGFTLVAAPTIATCTWLIFFPPQRYLDRITARTAANA